MPADILGRSQSVHAVVEWLDGRRHRVVIAWPMNSQGKPEHLPSDLCAHVVHETGTVFTIMLIAEPELAEAVDG